MTATAYRYSAVDEAGRKRRGTVDAAERAEAFRLVSSQGLTPLEIRAAAAPRLRHRPGVPARDVAHFTYQFAVLISARIPIADGLRSIAEQEPNATLRHAVADIAARIEGGAGIAESMDRHRDVFGETYVQTVRAAEASGNLPKILEYLSEMLDRADHIRRQVRSALLYPGVVLCVLIAATTFLLAFVVPRFAGLYEARGIELPMITRLLAGLGESVRTFWWAYLGALVGALVAGRWAWHQPSWALAADRAMHRVPFLRTILVGLGVARFSRVLGLCLSAGLGLIDCLSLAARSSGRPLLERDAALMIERVSAGGRISDVLSSCRYLPPFARRMLAAGEESADLSRLCRIVARQHEREAEMLTRNLATLIEPVLVVTIALVVLVVALGIFLPMWNMVSILG